MNDTIKPYWRPIAALLLGFTLAPGSASADAHIEQPSVVNAASILPPNIVTGPNHRVGDQVYNDGFLNIYTIESKYGEQRAVSTATLYKRIGELNAMAGMEKVKGTEEFRAGMKEKAGDFVEGGVMLVKNPVASVKGAASGVASIFRSVSKTLEYGRSETEGGRLSVISGFDKTKREYAAEFNVDVYSRNEHLQKELNELSRAGFLGTSIVRLGTAAVGGAAGAGLSLTGNVEALNDLLRTKSAGALRVMNEQTLQKIAVSAEVIELFLENRNYTISQQTALVLALDSMSATLNRDAFVKFAALTENEDMAAFRRRQAEMYAAYNRKVAPVGAFQFLGQVAFARKKGGAVLFSAPLDHMLWTSDLAAFVHWVNGQIDALPNVNGKELWVVPQFEILRRLTKSTCYG